MSICGVGKVVGTACIAAVVACWALAAGPTGAAGTTQSVNPARSMTEAAAWLKGHVAPYRFTTTYEDGALVTWTAGRKGCLAVRSFDVPLRDPAYRYIGKYGRSFLYDNAVSVVALTMLGENARARGILATMERLQNRDDTFPGQAGSLGFSWNTRGDNFYNQSYLRTGAICWAGYAAVYYELATWDRSFDGLATGIGDWVLAQQISDPADLRDGLVTGGWGAWNDEYTAMTYDRLQWCGMEHQVDAYFFLRDLGRLTGNDTYTQAANRIKTSVLAVLWDDVDGRFYAGTTSIDQGGEDRTAALDANSWGAIFAQAAGESDKARRCLQYVEAHFQSTDGAVTGYRPYDGYCADYPAIPDWGAVNMVWSEGSLGVAQAHLATGDRTRAAGIIAQMIALQSQSPSRGLKYVVSDVAGVDDFHPWPSAAGTAWQITVLSAMRTNLWGQ